jgi:hypothetical protein
MVLLGGVLPAGAGEVRVKVKNPLERSRPAEVVALGWEALRTRVEGLGPENARVLDETGEVVLSQVVDNDGDGREDEFLFLAELGPGQSRVFRVVADASLPPRESEARTYARYVPERKDDFAWENDVVAFRAYGPALLAGDENSGFDCFLKRVKYPILDKWYAAEKRGLSYHIDYGEGYDGYKVGSSLGCGGSAVWSGGKLHLGEVYREWQLHAQGPLRACFTLSYGPWEVEGRAVTETRNISLDLGQRLFKVEEVFQIEGQPADLEIALGLATHEGKARAFVDRGRGRLYCWEEIDGAGLGTAVIVEPALIKDYQLITSTNKYEGNAFFVVAPGVKGRFTYYAGYGWEKAGDIVTPAQWEHYLDEFIARVRHPVTATME